MFDNRYRLIMIYFCNNKIIMAMIQSFDDLISFEAATTKYRLMILPNVITLDDDDVIDINNYRCTLLKTKHEQLLT